MTINKNDFHKRLTTAPIYNELANELYEIQNQQNSNEPIAIGKQTPSTWQKWFQNVHNITSATNYYGYPSVCLNSDFYWNTAIANPVTQAAGDGAFFSEKWQVQGAAVATYTLTRTTFTGNDADQTGSTVYVNVAVTAWTGAAFYFYQRQAGAQFLRRYQGRNLFLSAKIRNNNSESIQMIFDVFFYYDTSSASFLSKELTIHSGENYLSSLIKPDMLTGLTIGGAPYVEFRLKFVTLPSSVADIDMIYIKAEMADYPTPLYVDHALERPRIDNS